LKQPTFEGETAEKTRCLLEGGNLLIIGVLTVELFLGEANSLKEKRRVVKGIIDRIKSRFNVSVAEVGEQDTWQRCILGISFVSCEQAHVHRALAAVVRFIEAQGTVFITDYRTELL
jgi:uncharacterized protein YlxP (DUF503 family)